MTVPAVLALEDGTVFRGKSIGAKGNTTGEVVFNTAITGYQEILTDPSYCRQIVTLTYPHVGNTGVNAEDLESSAIYAAGLVIRDLPLLASSWRSSESLSEFLQRGKVVAIADIDTRKLTRVLRDKGAQAGCIMTGESIDQTAAVRAARKFPGLKGMDLAKVGHDQAPVSVERGEPVARQRSQPAATGGTPACRCLRLRHQAQHPATARRSRLPHDRRAGDDAGRQGPRTQSRWHLSVERAR